MAERRLSERIILHDAIETVEVDFSDLTFASASDVDAFYDEANRALAATGPLTWHDFEQDEVLAEPELLGDVVLGRRDAPARDLAGLGRDLLERGEPVEDVMTVDRSDVPDIVFA